jgi:hypothetical protein
MHGHMRMRRADASTIGTSSTTNLSCAGEPVHRVLRCLSVNSLTPQTAPYCSVIVGCRSGMRVNDIAVSHDGTKLVAICSEKKIRM